MAALATTTDECVLWPHAVDRKGYGSVSFGGRSTKAHRYVCELQHGPPPAANMVAAHSCDTPGCINPHHLRWATYAENSADMTARRRQAQGEGINHSKLTQDKVAEIRRLRATGFTLMAIATRFGITEGNVSLIVNRRTWRETT